ncbi:MAG: GMC family oxidoreductase [Pseudomonadota bacterium]
MSEPSYSLIAVGTGFATIFFLHRYLRSAPEGARVLLLERGPAMPHSEQLERAHDEPLDGSGLVDTAGAAGKTWRFSVGLGGGSNCWWACTPRFMPGDLEMRSRYGVGEDWPIGYDDLEPYYAEAEEIMAISGAPRMPYRMSRPYPQPPHELSRPDALLQAAYGDLYTPQPTARARLGTENRAPCCANGVCSICPVNAKFTIENEMSAVLQDPRVTLLTGAEVLAVETEGGLATGVRYRREGREEQAAGEMVALGANAIFNAFILLRSGFDDAALGRYLHEQGGIEARVNLTGLRNFTGSTVITGQGFMFYEGAHRAERAGALMEGWNRARPRLAYNRWAEVVPLRLVFEDLPLFENRVEISSGNPERPLAVTERRSAYFEAGIAAAPGLFEEMMGHLPAEDYELGYVTTNEAHVLGTARMGTDPEASVVDDGLVHHRVRNLLVLGGSSFVTGPPANPTLTISALSLRAADRLA